MDIGRIAGSTRTIGKSQGYRGLPIRDDAVPGLDGTLVPQMTTAWIPNPTELAALMAGASVHVQLLGRMHPPIKVVVGPPPEKD